MPITVVWDDPEETIIRWNFSDPWNWQDFRKAFDQSVEMAGSKPYRVDVIPHVSDSKVPVPLGALSEFKRVARLKTKNTIMIVVAGGNIFATTVISVFNQIYGGGWYLTDSLEAARKMIATDRAKTS